MAKSLIWTAQGYGDASNDEWAQWYVINDRGDYHRGRPCQHSPQGRVIAYRSEQSAQRKADELNRLETPCPGNDGRHELNTDGVMMHCPSCGNPTPAHASKCEHCGYSPYDHNHESEQ